MNISDLGIVAIPVITVIVFLIVEAVKATPLDNKWLPVVAGFFGGCLGLAAMFVMPDFPAADPLTAVAVGIVSGLSATGCHQVYKQLLKDEHKEPAQTVEADPETEPDDYLGRH